MYGKKKGVAGQRVKEKIMLHCRCCPGARPWEYGWQVVLVLVLVFSPNSTRPGVCSESLSPLETLPGGEPLPWMVGSSRLHVQAGVHGNWSSGPSSSSVATIQRVPTCEGLPGAETGLVIK